MELDPQAISERLGDDNVRGTTILPGAVQAPEDLQAWEEFLPRARPRGVLELGTGRGAFAKWLSVRVEWFRTVDKQEPDPGTPGFVRLHVFKQPDEVRELIASAPRPLVLFCDNGSKRAEVEMFAPALSVGDFLAVHDLGTEILHEEIPANYTLWHADGLTGFYRKDSPD